MRHTTYIFCYFIQKTNLFAPFFSTVLKGNIQMVHDVKKSMTYRSNSYFDNDFQLGENDRKDYQSHGQPKVTPQDVNSFSTSSTLNNHF